MKKAVIEAFRLLLIMTASSIPVMTPSNPSVTKNKMLYNYFVDAKKVSGIKIRSVTTLNVSGMKATIQKYTKDETIHLFSDTKWNYSRFTILDSISSPSFIAAYIMGRIAVVASSVVMKFLETSEP